MRWAKRGIVVAPGERPWMLTHAQNPFVEHVKNDLYKVHFAGRDSKNMSRGGYAEVVVKNGLKLSGISKDCTLDIGETGCFDDCGAMPSCIVDDGHSKLMYYTGWERRSTTPFAFYIGLAESTDGGKHYERVSKAPVMGRTHDDPFLVGSPWVVKENGEYMMWYASGTGWHGRMSDGRPHNHYHLKHASSVDGIEWKPSKSPCIDYCNKDEYAFGRPVVFKEDGIYKLFYSYMRENDHYRVGYAESADGLDWARKDSEAGLEVSPTGWDSEMVCYACPFTHGDVRYLLYNGNKYGAGGAGYAVEIK